MSSPSTLVEVVYDYKACDDSELSLTVGDLIVVVDRSDEDGWWSGYIKGSPSEFPLYFPSNYTKPVASRNDEQSPKTTDLNTVPKQIPVGSPTNVRQPIQLKRIAYQKTVRNSETRYRAYGSNMVLGLGPLTAIAGLISLSWASNDSEWDENDYSGVGVYAFWFGILSWLLERLHPGQSNPDSLFSIRGSVYAFFSLPLFFGLVTLAFGIFYLVASAFFFLAAVHRERYSPTKPHLPLTDLCRGFNLIKMFSSDSSESWKDFSKRKYTEYHEANKIGEIAFVSIYFLVISIIFLVTLIEWIKIVEDLDEEDKLSGWAPFAKAFGGVLNFTCSIIVLPVSRTLIRYLHNYSTDHSESAKILRSVLYWIPLDKSLEFHYLVGWTVYIAAIGHTVFHYINFGIEPDNTLDTFNVWPFISGGIILACMLLLYAAVLPSVKRGHFEIFWYSHHVFAIFFLMLLLHGRNGIGPNFWKYCLFPFLVYAAERVYREYSAYRTVSVTSITNMNEKVMIVEFSKSSAFGEAGYKEGQYAYLNCPHISRGQWHPFTISSAPQDTNVTVHIRIQGARSWTKQLFEYLTLMGPKNKPHFKLSTLLETNDEIPGKTIGPDGRQILKVYGPLSAPTQHISEYEVDLIIGAGIGVTPVSSCLQSIVHFRWKFSTGIAYPSHVHFVWVCSYRDIPSFRWMVRTIKVACDALKSYKERNELVDKSARIHIYITSTPIIYSSAEDADLLDISEKLKSAVDDSAIWGHCSDGYQISPVKDREFTEIELYSILKNPPQEPTSLGSFVQIYNGRPNWSSLFETVRHQHYGKEIGVAFCGNPGIGNALKDTCKSFSSAETNTFFRLHKENF